MSSKQTHWSTLTRNPISKEAQRNVRAVLTDKYCGAIHQLPQFWKEKLEGKTVLDIGAVEHAIEFVARSGWKHDIFRSLAAKTVGVDVLAAEVAELNSKGYDVRVCDATSEADLGERFDVVYVGDVIEHVENPVALLKFGARHLNLDGEMIVTTPCPFWWRNICLMISDHTFVGNVDHVRWVCPVNALELAHRAGISLDGYHTIETYGRSLPRKAIQSVINGLLGRNELFTWAYVYRFVPEATT